jgi:hypothetical protein
MNGAASNNRGFSTGAKAHRSAFFLLQSKLLRALFASLLVVCGVLATASHAKFLPQTQIASVGIENSQADSNSETKIFGGIEHHACGCPCLEPIPMRAHYITAFLEGSRVNYPAYLDSFGDSIEPAPIRKPPRRTARA